MKANGKFYGYYMNLVCVPPYYEKEKQKLDECLQMENSLVLVIGNQDYDTSEEIRIMHSFVNWDTAKFYVEIVLLHIIFMIIWIIVVYFMVKKILVTPVRNLVKSIKKVSNTEQRQKDTMKDAIDDTDNKHRGSIRLTETPDIAP